VPYAIERFRTETARLYGVLEGQLQRQSYVAGDYSIADMAIYPWVSRHEWQGIDLADYPQVARWAALVGERAAVRRGMEVPA